MSTPDVAGTSQSDDEPLYNTAAVERRTGVPAATFRAWERRHGFPHPARDAQGQRLYAESDITAIRWLADQTARGIVVSRAIAMLRRGYAQPPQPVVPAEPVYAARPPEVIKQELQAALLGFTAERAEALFAEALALYPLDVVCDSVLQPMLVEVGERWHAGSLSVAEEHYASGFVRTRLFSLLRVYEREGDAPTIFTGCAPGEWHEIALLMLSVLLARDGFRIRYLGPNVPVESLSEPLQQHRPDLLVLSAGSVETARALLPVRELLAALPPPPPLFAYAGRVFDQRPAIATETPGTYLGREVETSRLAVHRLLAAPPTA